MKKYILAGLVALVVLVCLPAAVSATGNTVLVSGSITGYITVDVTPPGGINWSAMSVGTKTDKDSADLSVTTTYNAWHVDAADAKSPNKGYMVDTGPTGFILTNPFYISNNPGDTTPIYVSMVTGLPNFAQVGSDGAGAWGPYDIGLQQVIVGTDEAATAYSITITFTGGSS